MVCTCTHAYVLCWYCWREFIDFQTFPSPSQNGIHSAHGLQFCNGSCALPSPTFPTEYDANERGGRSCPTPLNRGGSPPFWSAAAGWRRFEVFVVLLLCVRFSPSFFQKFVVSIEFVSVTVLILLIGYLSPSTSYGQVLPVLDEGS